VKRILLVLTVMGGSVSPLRGSQRIALLSPENESGEFTCTSWSRWRP
jgi:hypothetical protein